jgi:protease-4
MNGCVIALLVVVGALLAMSLLVMAFNPLRGGGSTGGFSVSTGGPRVGVINIDGVIMDQSDVGLFGSMGGTRAVTDYIREAAKDNSIKAVVLRINSPGGSAAASQSVYQEVMKLRAKKPVIASMGDVAASGGYYIASGASTIMASPATTTGSIGVIFSSMNYGALANKFGVTDQTITSGAFKDSGSPMRPMRPEERKLYKDLILEVYEQFLSDVAAGRKMDKAVLRKLADGRVYTGSQAKRAKLIDDLGNYYDAVELAAKKASIEGEPSVKRYGAGRGFSSLFGEEARMRQMSPVDRFLSTSSGLGPGVWTVLAGHNMVLAQ